MTAFFRRVRPARRPRGRASSRLPIGNPLERLEPRALLTASAPTDAEQYMLELINRARANPAAEGQRLVALAGSDPMLRRATARWDLGLFSRTISSYAPEPPLAFNPRLIDAALAEDASMLAKNSQQHSPAGFLTNPTVAVDGDGLAYYPTGSGGWATGENIFAYAQGVAATPTAYADYFEAGFLLDWGNPDFGHLKNLLAPGPAEANFAAGIYPFNEVGVGLVTGVTPTVPPPSNPSNPANGGLNVGPAIVTQEFGWRQGTSFLTGTFFIDYQGTHLYSPGEGLGSVTIRAVGTAGQGTFATQTWSSGGYSLALPPGTYQVTASGPLPGARTTTVTIGADNVAWGVGFDAGQQADLAVPVDYDGIGRAEVATYRPSTGDWTIVNPATGPRTFHLGMPGDIPVPGSYDGGPVEPAVFRPSDATWHILGPNGLREGPFGQPGDIPVPGSYDGKGTTDLGLYRPSSGTWYIWHSRTQTLQVKQWGIPGLDQPVPAAYDGGGVAEIAVLDPTTWQWFIIGPSGPRVVQYGCPGCIPVPGDYEGLGKAEVAVYQPATGGWFIQDTGTIVHFGIPGLDQPAPAEYDGDGKLDLAVFRPNTAEWFVKGSKGDWIYTQAGQGGTAQTLKGVISARVAVSPGWADWVGSPGAVAAHGPAPGPIEPVAPRVILGPTATHRPGSFRVRRPVPIGFRPGGGRDGGSA